MRIATAKPFLNTKGTKVTKEVQRRKKSICLEAQAYLKRPSELLSVLRVLCGKKIFFTRIMAAHRRMA